MKQETFVLHFTDGTRRCEYCKKSELENFISVAELRKLDYIQQLNRAADKVNHKPFTIKI